MQSTQHSFEEIYALHKNKVFNLALHYVQNAEDATEITQDVFVTIHQKLATFRDQAHISTWIYRITINKALDFIKARKRKKRWAFITSIFDVDAGMTNEPVHFDHPGVQLEQKEAVERIFKWINELPENQRTALILSKLEHKPQSEIAEIMNLSPKAVESLVQRAKSNLAKKMKASEGFSS